MQRFNRILPDQPSVRTLNSCRHNVNLKVKFYESLINQVTEIKRTSTLKTIMTITGQYLQLASASSIFYSRILLTKT